MTDSKKPKYTLHGRIWIEGKEGTFLGYGRVILLERIREYGSISAAARSMQMSYRHAWKLVNSINKQSETPIVKSSTGGRGGGGAALTEAGEHAIKEFWSFFNEYQDFIKTYEDKKLSL